LTECIIWKKGGSSDGSSGPGFGFGFGFGFTGSFGFGPTGSPVSSPHPTSANIANNITIANKKYFLSFIFSSYIIV
jgi:hypothetical protein